MIEGYQQLQDICFFKQSITVILRFWHILQLQYSTDTGLEVKEIKNVRYKSSHTESYYTRTQVRI